MRITGGKFGGRALATPRDSRVRPTSDKVRQAIFNTDGLAVVIARRECIQTAKSHKK